MNAEALFFSALLHSEDVGALRGVQKDHLSESYQLVYDYITGFVGEHGKLPRFDTVDARFPRLVSERGGEDASFYAREIQQNAMRVELEDGIRHQVVPHLAEQRGDDALAGARTVVTDVSERFRETHGGTRLDMQEGVDRRMQAYRYRQMSQGAIGIPTPWGSLTMATGGVQTCDAVAVLARPNIGKTWLLILWAVFLWQKRYRVLFCSMETPPEARKPRNRNHRIIGRMCLRCYDHEAVEGQECPAADTPDQRLSIRFDALGARLSAWRLYKGRLTPREEERLERYYHACQTNNNGRWGDLRIVASPYIKTVADLEMEIHQYQPDIVFWDSAYLAAQPGRRRGENPYATLCTSFKLMLERTSIPGVVSWHFNRDVDEKATNAGMGAGALTDELPRVFDTILGLFRPAELEEAGEAIIRGLKVRDGMRMGKIKTRFEVKSCVDFSEIGDAGE